MSILSDKEIMEATGAPVVLSGHRRLVQAVLSKLSSMGEGEIKNPYSERIANIYKNAKGILNPDVTLEIFIKEVQKPSSELYGLFNEHYLFSAEQVFNEGAKAQHFKEQADKALAVEQARKETFNKVLNYLKERKDRHFVPSMIKWVEALSQEGKEG